MGGRFRGLCLLLLGCSVHAARAQEQAELSSSALVEPVPELATEPQSLREQRARKSAAEGELSVLPDVQRSLEETLARDVRALYRLKRGGLLPLAGGLQTFMTHASRVAHLERMARRTLAELAKTRSGREQLAKEVQVLEAEISAGEQLLAATVEEPTPAERSPLNGPPDADRSDGDQPLEARPPFEDRVGYGLSLVGESELPHQRSFASERGALALPVSAPTSVHATGDGLGVALSTQSGASVRAAADGRVVMAGRDEARGMMVVIDHGRRYRTSYAGLAAVDVQVGDSVSKSARLGSAGATPIDFEVQRGARPQNARAWLGL
jgi:murein hydrolase activator